MEAFILHSLGLSLSVALRLLPILVIVGYGVGLLVRNLIERPYVLGFVVLAIVAPVSFSFFAPCGPD